MSASRTQIEFVRALLLQKPRTIREISAVIGLPTRLGPQMPEAVANVADDCLSYLRAEPVVSDEEQLGVVALRDRLGTLVDWQGGADEAREILETIPWRLPNGGGGAA